MSIFDTMLRETNLSPIDRNLLQECYEYVDFVICNKPQCNNNEETVQVEKFKIPTWDDIKHNYIPQQQQETPTETTPVVSYKYNNVPKFQYYSDILEQNKDK